MSNVTLKAALRRWSDKRNDKGQGAVEYVGVIVLVALIIGAIVGSDVDATIADGLSNTVDEILGGE